MNQQIAEMTSPLPIRTGNLLLVDDEENILASLRRLLRRDGYHIHVANSGQAGLDVLSHQAIDVIVSDQRMPIMTGTEFLRRARDLCPETVRIVLSGYTELESVTAAINEGSVYRFLTKPWDDAQLRHHIAEAMRHKQIDDENRRLQGELQIANRQLKELLEERQRRLAIGEASLHFTHEMMAALPLAVIGVDTENLIVLANDSAQRLLHGTLVGMPADCVLPPALCALLGSELPAGGIDVALDRQTVCVVSRPVGNPDQPRGRLFAFFPGGGAS